MNQDAPIVITGCPRSGTQMMGRVFGNLSDQFCLITEHSNKKGDIPEDRSGVEDHRLWWEAFDYPSGYDGAGVPLVDIPDAPEDRIVELRRRYERIAKGRQIVIKNPSHILYPTLIRKVFPDAQFVYCARNPWITLQSMTKAGTGSFLLRSPRIDMRQFSLLHNAAIGWHDAMDSFFTLRDDRWVVAQYEQIVADPRGSITQICQQLGLTQVDGLEAAIAVPKPSSNNDFYCVKQAFATDPRQQAVLQELDAGCEFFQYPRSPDYLEGTMISSMIHRVTSKAKRKIMKLAG